MPTCRLCPAPIASTAVVCEECAPTWLKWKTGKRAFRKKAAQASENRRQELSAPLWSKHLAS